MFKHKKATALRVAAITLLILGATFYFLDRTTSGTSNLKEHVGGEQPFRDIVATEPPRTQQSANTPSPVAEQDKHLPGQESEDEELSDTDMQMRLAGLPTPEEAKRGNELSKKWGYFSMEEREVYLTYSDETLNALSEEGDLLALDILLNRAMENYANDPEKAEALLERAAVYGSTLAVMGKAMGASTFGSVHKKDSAEYRDAMQESMAWYQFGLMRGDLSLRDNIRRTMEETGFEPTSQDKKAIAKRAQEIYDQLSERRRELGLGEYDNEVPEGLENYFNFLTE